MSRVLAAGLLTCAAPLWAEDAPTAPRTDFVAVAIDGSLNLRAGPTTASERLTRFVDGTLLRRIGCLSAEDGDWCEVETIDGAIEGWAAARFLRPFFGADPAALESPALAATERLSAAAPGRFAGTLEQGAVLDLMMEVPMDREITIAVNASDGVGFAVFAADGTVIDTGRGVAEFSLVSLSDEQFMIRFADVAGATATWSLTVDSE